jgi:hypothetical protein
LHQQTDSEETGEGCDSNYGTTSGDASAIVDITIKGS